MNGSRSLLSTLGLLRCQRYCSIAVITYIVFTAPTSHGRPWVIITDADGAMTSSISALLPHTKHLYCSCHSCMNIKKHCMGALQKAGCKELLRRFTAASYATSTEVGRSHYQRNRVLLGFILCCAPALTETETHVVVTTGFRVCSPGAYCTFVFFPVSRPLIACGRA